MCFSLITLVFLVEVNSNLHSSTERSETDTKCSPPPLASILDFFPPVQAKFELIGASCVCAGSRVLARAA